MRCAAEVAFIAKAQFFGQEAVEVRPVFPSKIDDYVYSYCPRGFGNFGTPVFEQLNARAKSDFQAFADLGLNPTLSQKRHGVTYLTVTWSGSNVDRNFLRKVAEKRAVDEATREAAIRDAIQRLYYRVYNAESDYAFACRATSVLWSKGTLRYDDNQSRQIASTFEFGPLRLGTITPPLEALSAPTVRIFRTCETLLLRPQMLSFVRDSENARNVSLMSISWQRSEKAALLKKLELLCE